MRKQMPNRPALIVEDDAVLCDAIRGALEDAGYEPTTCAALSDARREIARHKPVVVVVDLSLPGEFGADLLEELASQKDAPAAVVCSAFSLAELIAARYRIPCVRKPFDLDQLLDAVDRAIDEGARPRKVA
jgi:DNA-binding NtrC family response regulator